MQIVESNIVFFLVIVQNTNIKLVLHKKTPLKTLILSQK